MSHAARTFEIEGHVLRYPTGFRDGRSANGMFLVDAGVANELIADSGFEVVEFLPGRAVLNLACVQYLDTDCGSYLETAQAFFIKRPNSGWRLPWASSWLDLATGNVSSFTWKLQVNTTLSQRCGIEMWGYPKTLERIEVEEHDEEITFSLFIDEQLVFKYSVEPEGSDSPEPIVADVYSIFEGAPHVGQLRQRYTDMAARFRGGRLELGGHAMSGELRALGVGERPLMSTWAGHLTFEMSAPAKL